MFNLFKKKKRWGPSAEEEAFFHERVLPILQAIANRLPKEYLSLKGCFIPSLLKGFSNNPLNSKGHYIFWIDQSSYKRFETETNNYAINNIRLFSKTLNEYVNFSLHVQNNLPIGFQLTIMDWNLELEKTDTSNIKVVDYGNLEYQQMLQFLGPVPQSILQHFDLNNSFKIELQGIQYFTIKEFGNGDYLAINNKREIFVLVHGKGIINKVFDNPEQFFRALESKQFDPKTYYESIA